MAQQNINLGTGELAGDGESLRTAFEKIEANLTELYSSDSGISLTDISVTSLSASAGGSLTYDNTTGVLTHTPAEVVTIKPFTIIAADNYVASNGERIVVPAAYPGSADILGFLNPVAGNWFVVVNGSTVTGSCRVDPEGTGSSYVTVADQTTATFVYDGTEWNTGV